ncbi:MAG: hypothetical protein KDE54_31900 [Caldilineaceae bacterium]|nr:hypothetical protein [Caldilineaceae bacterium]
MGYQNQGFPKRQPLRRPQGGARSGSRQMQRQQLQPAQPLAAGWEEVQRQAVKRLRQPEVKKKLTTLIVSVVLLVLNDVFNLGVDRQTIAWLVGLVATYLLGQGLADIGKERAIIQAKAGTAEHVEIDYDVDYGMPMAGAYWAPPGGSQVGPVGGPQVGLQGGAAAGYPQPAQGVPVFEGSPGAYGDPRVSGSAGGQGALAGGHGGARGAEYQLGQAGQNHQAHQSRGQHYG